MEPKKLNLTETFKALGQLVSKQKSSTANFNASSAYGENQNSNLNESAIQLLNLAYSDMKLADREELKDWKFTLKMKTKDLIDSDFLYDHLRKLPSQDITKIRIFNRIVGQQQLTTTISDLFQLQEQKLGLMVNPFYDTFSQLIQSFSTLFNQKFSGPKWPTEKISGPDRQTLMDEFKAWRQQWLQLPGFSRAKSFFEENDSQVFNAFFHVQRQFDSDNWRNFDKDDMPYPQALPKVFAYRKAISSMGEEFDNAEMSVNMCFDYCKMSKDRVVSFVLEAENAFLNIVTRLDDQYPIDLDYAHHELHEQSHKVKLMMFPLRCLFFDDLENHRGVKDSNDHTLDSYMDMTLVENDVHLPTSYLHQEALSKLETEAQEAFKNLLKNPQLDSLESKSLVTYIQSLPQDDLDAHGPIFDKLCGEYEEKFKSDEENLTRRFIRLAYLYIRAMKKKSLMKKASEDRLKNIQAMADRYAEQATRFESMEIKEEGADINSLSDDQLPLMASPQQMEDLYRTQKVVQKLSGSDDSFEATAKQIQEGLESALKMMKEAGELMERMINKIFPHQADREDLLNAVHEMIELGYETQQTLADLAKKESMNSASKNKKIEAEIEKLKQTIEDSKTKTQELQFKLRDILMVKREMVNGMRITQGEKDAHLNQLRMITVMTINSLNSQKED